MKPLADVSADVSLADANDEEQPVPAPLTASGVVLQVDIRPSQRQIHPGHGASGGGDQHTPARPAADS